MKRILAFLLISGTCFGYGYNFGQAPYGSLYGGYANPAYWWSHLLTYPEWLNTTVLLNGDNDGVSFLTDYSPQKTDVQIVNNNCLTLNGASEYMTADFGVTNAALFSSGTLSIVFNAEVKQSKTLVNYGGYVAGSSGSGYEFFLDMPYLGFDSLVTANEVINSNTWYKAEVDINSAGRATALRVYDLEGSLLDSASGLSDAPTITTSLLTVGVGGEGYFDGQIAEVRFTGSTNFWYTFAEGSGSKVYNKVAGGPNGTLTGTLSTMRGSLDGPVAHNLIRGHSKVLYFDGTLGCSAEYETGSTASGYFGACSIKSGVIFNSSGTVQVVHAHGAGAYRLYLTDSSTLAINTTDTLVPVSTDTYYDCEVVYNSSGQGTELKLNGSSVWTGTSPAGSPSGASKFQVGARQNSLNLNGLIKYCHIVGGNDPHTWDARDGYNTDIPNGLASANLTLNGTAEFLYIPALDDGTDDALGLGLTNPTGLVHNNAESDLNISSTNYSFGNLLTNELFTVTTNGSGFITELYK